LRKNYEAKQNDFIPKIKLLPKFLFYFIPEG
jgi:hypothetical protein